MRDTTSPKTRVIKVWDPVVRSFHWLLVLAFAGAWGLGEWGPNQMTWHFYFGYVIAGLVGVRLIWGFVGTRNARFTSFLFGPGKVVAYLRHLPSRDPSHWIGHNPMGGWSVFLMLALLIAQVATGMMSDPKDYINVGPLAQYVPSDISDLSVKLHHILSTLLLIVVGMHIAAILFYRRWKGENLVTPMITGKKVIEED
ncbi:cytochrome b/b6 domain-containing protein [uncultured Thioclava sp.]|jgi:cytochrome b|uniref:cytochrome b/b6 domain-containing protein n=1 Tax=uncultured Thioclava sp. TaxID=473858 RepID=UPI0025D714AF|nr:cytochrome b/b6 domain-containing protein [uncultured Thioclava sp.]